MHPSITQALAADRARELREQAAATRRANEARRARRGRGPTAPRRASARRPGAARWA